MEYDERESSVVDEGDALVIESTGEDLIENFDDGDDENEENDMSSDQIEDHGILNCKLIFVLFIEE